MIFLPPLRVLMRQLVTDGYDRLLNRRGVSAAVTVRCGDRQMILGLGYVKLRVGQSHTFRTYNQYVIDQMDRLIVESPGALLEIGPMEYPRDYSGGFPIVPANSEISLTVRRVE